MLKPSAEVRVVDGALVGELWDCLRLDPVAITQLRNKVEEHLRRGEGPNLVVDLNGVGFAGSAALGGLMAIQRACRQHGGSVVLCNVEPMVQEVLRTTKLDNLLPMVPGLEEALDRFRRDGEPGPTAKPSGPPAGGPLRRSRKPDGPPAV